MDKTSFKYLFPFEKVPQGSSIVIYGAGEKGQAYFEQLMMTKYCKVVALADRNYTSYQFAVPVCSPNQIANYAFDYVVIALSGPTFLNEFLFVLQTQGVPKEKIVWQENRQYTDLFQNNKLSKGISEQSAWKISPHNLLVYFTGGIGDNIVQKKIIETFVELDPNLCIDAYCSANLSFLQFLYEDMSQIHWIKPNLGFHYNAELSRYATALRFYGVRGLSIDTLKDENVFSQELKDVLTHLKDYIDKHPLTGSTFEMFYRCRYRKENVYQRFLYGGIIPCKNQKVHIPRNIEGQDRFTAMNLKSYITVNYGNGSSSKADLVAKAWPRIYFEKLIVLLHEYDPTLVIVQLGSGDIDPLQGVDKSILGEKFSLVTEVLRHSMLHIDIDGGLVHLASQLGTKCTVLFGPTLMEYYAYTNNINIRVGDCYGCYCLYEDCNRCAREKRHPPCMYDITPELVMDAVREYLEGIR